MMEYKECYEELVQAIVVQAKDDWLEARQKLHSMRNPQTALEKERYRSVLADLEEVEDFFKSDWFITLTGVDGKRILNRMREEL